MPRILSDLNVDLFSTKEPLKAIEYQNESNAVTMNDDRTKDELETSKGTADEVELAPIVVEQDFKENYLTEKHLQEIAVNFIAVERLEVNDEVHDTKNHDQDFPNVEGMIKGIFPQLLAGDNGEVGLALNCVYEINFKPGIKPAKQRVRRVTVD